MEQNKIVIEKEKIKDAIKECKILRLNTNESLTLIREHTGKKISDRTYRRYKSEIENSIDARFEKMVKGEIINEHLQRIDTLKKIEREYWQNYESTDSVPTRKSLLDSIVKIQDMITSYYNAERIMSGLSRWLDAGLEKIKKQKESLTPEPFADYNKMTT